MEESGTSIRDEEPEAPKPTPRSWICDANDKPVVEYIHASDVGQFRIHIGGTVYERFQMNGAGEWLYRRVR